MSQDTKFRPEDQGQQKVQPRIEDSDDLQFEVSEAHQSGNEFVGGKKGFQGSGDDLGVQSPSEILDGQHKPVGGSLHADDKLELADDFGSGLHEITPHSGENNQVASVQKTPQATAPEQPRQTETARIRQLSEDELKKIEQNLYGGSSVLSVKEKSDLVAKLSALKQPSALTASPSATTTGSQPSSHLLHPAPGALQQSNTNHVNPEVVPNNPPRRGRGIAYFYKNWVQIVTSHPLREEDEIIMGDRAYILRPKKLSASAKMGIGGVLGGLAICLAVVMMVGGNDPGDGSIVGMVLDANGQPYIQGAIIQVTEGGLRAETNGMGMFRISDVPKGSHKLDILVGGKTVGSDFATATDNDLTMTVVRIAQTPPPDQPQQTRNDDVNTPETVAENSAQSSTPEPPKLTTQPVGQRENITRQPAQQPRMAKLILSANVPDARITLDGNVLGAGNNTYSQIRAGEHKYVISRDGYKPISGVVKLADGESKTLAIRLEAVPSASSQPLSETLMFEKGGSKMQSGDYSGAIAEYSKAIDMKPSYAEAYVMRGEAYRAARDPRAAHDDYVKAAEIYRFRRDPSNAQTAFAKAIEVDSRSVAALLGRADLFLSQGQEIAALADYEAVLRLDKRSFDANFGLGRCRFDQGNYKQAERHFKDARDLDKKNLPVHEYLLICHMQMSQLKDLKKTWDQYRDVADAAAVARLRADSRFAAAIRMAETQ